MNVFEVHEGSSPIVLAFPHGGVWVPEDIEIRLNAVGLGRSDTDWHIHRLYGGLLDDATTVQATFHRYVVDANRPPDGQSLYPGQNTTGLCPLTDFDNQPIWKKGEEPDAGEIERRRLSYHAPYHAALAEQIARIKAKHGVAILFDGHSIRSRIPHLFEGTLPDFNIGTNSGASCAPSFERSITGDCAAADGYTHVLNGRFKGGWTTRHHGQPETGVHAIQLELAQSTYMREAAPWDYDETKAGRVRARLQTVLRHLESLAREGLS